MTNKRNDNMITDRIVSNTLAHCLYDPRALMPVNRGQFTTPNPIRIGNV